MSLQHSSIDGKSLPWLVSAIDGNYRRFGGICRECRGLFWAHACMNWLECSESTFHVYWCSITLRYLYVEARASKWMRHFEQWIFGLIASKPHKIDTQQHITSNFFNMKSFKFSSSFYFWYYSDNLLTLHLHSMYVHSTCWHLTSSKFWLQKQEILVISSIKVVMRQN